jgi:hypothetical protein
MILESDIGGNFLYIFYIHFKLIKTLFSLRDFRPFPYHVIHMRYELGFEVADLYCFMVYKLIYFSYHINFKLPYITLPVNS